MKINLSIVLIFGTSVAVAVCGCRRKSDAKTELEKAASALSTTETAPAALPVPSQSPQPVEATTVPQPAPAPSASQQMKEAMAAYKAGNLEDAVTRLQKLRATPVMTPEQRIALNDAMGAVMMEIYSLAEKGDARAKLAVKQYEQMQTRRQ